MTLEELQAKLKSDNPTGCYLFCGEEAYLKRAYLGQLREKILTDPAFDTFNHTVHEGAEIDFGILTEEMTSAPFFAPFKLIEWHMADLSSLNEKKIDHLLELAHLQQAEGQVALVILTTPEGFDVGTPKRPSSAYKKLQGAYHIVNFEKATDQKLLGWLKRHFEHEGMTAEASALRAMLFRSGHSMDILANETEKLVAYLKYHARNNVTERDVTEICASNLETEAFALTNALQSGNEEAAYRALQEMRARRVESIVIFSQISRLYAELSSASLLLGEGASLQEISKILSIHAYRAEQLVKAAKRCPTAVWSQCTALCREVDGKIKLSYGAEVEAQIDRLVGELLYLTSKRA